MQKAKGEFGLSAAENMTWWRESWSAPPEILDLADRDVHVWRASLDVPPARVQAFAGTLSEDERERAGRFFFDRDRSRFIVCRGVLRAILGRYLHVEPELLKFCYSRHGKPALSIASDGDAPRFNVSHACGLALYGVTLGRAIGIDVERIRPELASDQIAEQFFSSREIAALRALSPASRLLGFFNCWTRKEAYIKARGEGLSLPLSGFDVSVAPSAPTVLLSVPYESEQTSRWLLRELFPGPCYVATIAVEGHDWQLRCWQWPEA